MTDVLAFFVNGVLLPGGFGFIGAYLGCFVGAALIRRDLEPAPVPDGGEAS